MNYLRISEEKTQLEQEIARLHAKIASLPPGKIYCSKSGKYVRWFLSDGHTSTYLNKSKFPLIRTLAQKKYLTLQLKYLTSELKILDTCLKKHVGNPNLASILLETSPEYRALLADSLCAVEQKIESWKKEPYVYNPLYPEQLIHPCPSGNYVRSKSEYMIASALFHRNIAFRYECSLELDSLIFYPDFTIMHPKTGKLLYWEHFGLMDAPEYRDKAFRKLRIYADHGILPGINLITTYETRSHPLTYAEIDHQIQHLLDD